MTLLWGEIGAMVGPTMTPDTCLGGIGVMVEPTMTVSFIFCRGGGSQRHLFRSPRRSFEGNRYLSGAQHDTYFGGNVCHCAGHLFGGETGVVVGPVIMGPK